MADDYGVVDGAYSAAVAPVCDSGPRRWGVSCDEFHVGYFDFKYDAAGQALEWGMESGARFINIEILTRLDMEDLHGEGRWLL